MTEDIVSLFLQHWYSVLLLISVVYLAKNKYHNGLQRYPGPFLASYTDWWRFFDVLGRRPDITQLKLHRKLGDIVRLGPNALSFSNPEALKTIYGLNKGFVKSNFYPVQQALHKGEALPSLFSTTDEQFHANLRRSVNSAFSMTSLVQYEPFVNVATEKFLSQTEALYSSKNAICNFSEWLQFFAFDVVGEMTYSKQHGFMDQAKDIDGIISYLGKLFSYAGPIGQLPILDYLLLKNPILRFLDKHGILSFTFPVVNFAKAHMSERIREMESAKTKGEDPTSIAEVRRGDMLSMFLKAKEDRPDFFDDRRVLTMAVSMSFAGSETTGISLSAVFYYLIKNTRCYEKLMNELDEATASGQFEDISTGLVTWVESQRLPYLDACIKEAFRLHPAVGLPLERIVPPQGANICGEMIPGGTIVGVNAWVLHQRTDVFGDDAATYRPERWLEADKEHKKHMDACMFQFGMGARTCIGKNISLLEIYKLVPTFLRRFEVQLANPDQEWRLHNAWFVKTLDFNTTFKPRMT